MNNGEMAKHAYKRNLIKELKLSEYDKMSVQRIILAKTLRADEDGRQLTAEELDINTIISEAITKYLHSVENEIYHKGA